MGNMIADRNLRETNLMYSADSEYFFYISQQRKLLENQLNKDDDV